MRNILISLTLCVFTLTTSSVFADIYDESRRTECFGLSFYDGRPLYIAFLYGYPDVLSATDYRLEAHRVMTGEDIRDFGAYQGQSGGIIAPNVGQYVVWGYYARGDDGQLTLLTSGRYNGYPLEGSDDWVSEALSNFDPGVSGGDLAVETYDRILPDAQDWARRGILIAVALLVLSTGLNKFRELTSGGSNVSSKGEKKSYGAASPQAEKPKLKKKIDTSEYLELEHESPYRLRTPRELREERARLDRENTERQQVMTEQEALREAYISGDYWGKSFSDEVRASNRELYEAFDKMDPFTRRLLIQKFDEMSFVKEATLLKSYNKDVYGFADDNIGNPFEGDDEEDGEPPF